MGLRLLLHQTHGWGWYTVYKPSGSYYGTFQYQSLMSYISINFRPSALTWLAVASSGQLRPVWSSLVCMTKNSIAWVQHQFRFRTLTMQMCCWIVDLTFNIIVNLCSKLHYEVLLKSGNYIVYLLKWTSYLDLSKGGCVIQIWVD